jgi:hypothetical protein
VECNSYIKTFLTTAKPTSPPTTLPEYATPAERILV